MASNAARKLNQPTPQLTPRPNQPTPQVKSHQHRLPFSPFEKILMIFGALIAFSMMIMVVTTQLSVVKQQHRRQNLQTQVANVKQQNVSDQQEVTTLTSQARLEQIAQKYGLTDANSSVRNVNK